MLSCVTCGLVAARLTHIAHQQLLIIIVLCYAYTNLDSTVTPRLENFRSW